MSLRAQSLLNLKMYKLNRHVLKDLQKQINEVLVKSNNDEETQQVRNPDLGKAGERRGHWTVNYTGTQSFYTRSLVCLFRKFGYFY